MAASSAIKPGIGGAVYRNTGNYGTPTWTEISLTKDAHVAAPWDLVEAGARQTRAKLYAKTRIDIGPRLTVRADDADAGFSALADAAVSPSTVPDLLILDGKVTVEGARGFRAEWNVNLDDQPQEIDGVIYDTFTLKPAWTANGYPGSVVMGTSNTPTITSF